MERDLHNQMGNLQCKIVECDKMIPQERVRRILELERARAAYIRAHERARDVIFDMESELRICE